MRTITVYEEVEVEVDADMFDTDDLIEALQNRGYIVCKDSILTRDQERVMHNLYQDYVENRDINKSAREVLDHYYQYVPVRSV